MLLKLLTLLLVLLQFAGCSVFPSVLYRIDVQQGNIVTQDMVEKLKPGMTMSQVRFVLGTPLIVDTFRDNRWDYVYLRQEKGELVKQERLTIYFENEILTHLENRLLSSGDTEKTETKDFYSEKIEPPVESVNNQN